MSEAATRPACAGRPLEEAFGVAMASRTVCATPTAEFRKSCHRWPGATRPQAAARQIR
jgi:hypothetical protein